LRKPYAARRRVSRFSVRLRVSGAIIPNAQVFITDIATGVVRTVATDAAGLYSAPNLLPGT